MKKAILTSVTLSFIFIHGFAQENNAKRKLWRANVSWIYSNVPSTKESLLKTEAHFAYALNEIWAVGISYTHKFIHNKDINDDIAIVGSWSPKKLFTINAGLNYKLPKKEEEGALGFYNEIEFNFKILEWMEIGPLAGSVLSKNTEIYAGIHLGVEF